VPQSPAARKPPSDLAVGVALAALTLTAFLPACRNGFVEFDDQMYVTSNPRVQAGLSSGLGWAVTDTHVNAWHPLAWWSLQFDATLFGLNPAGFHLTNVLLHTAAAVTLFLALRRMTGAVWRSAAAAALFAVHPLRVEAVAWVSERKDVLAVLAGAVALWAYARYTERPSVSRYLPVAAALTVGLLAKPVLVTLPFALLLLDYWPLRRLGRRALLEKLPLVALAAAGAAVTVAAQRAVLGTADEFPPAARLANAVYSYVWYLGATAWPGGLAAFYPHPRGGLSAAAVIGSAAVLATVTAGAVWQARRRPYLLVGWLWFLGTLVPMIGLVQVALHGRADRYTYLPAVGLSVAVVWWLAEWVPASVARVGGTVLAVVLVLLTWQQIGYWRDTATLWEHAVAVTADNYEAHRNLGFEYQRQGKDAAALRQFEAALRSHPRPATVHNHLAEHWLARGEFRRAADHLRAAEAADPTDPLTRNNIGGLLVTVGKPAEAEPHLLAAAAARPTDPGPRFNLALALAALKRWAEADEWFAAGVAVSPDNPDAAHSYGVALRDAGEPGRALPHLRAAVASKPDAADRHHDLGQALEAAGDPSAAVAAYRRAAELAPAEVRHLCGLGHAAHAAGNASAATEAYRRADRLAPGWDARADGQAWRLAVHPADGLRNGRLAVRLAEQANQATGFARPGYLDTLAAAYAEVGRFEEAAATADRAIAAALPELAAEVRTRLALYRDRKPFRGTAAPPPR
jgi:tetratricopeptide (TPR) repeat protein